MQAGDEEWLSRQRAPAEGNSAVFAQAFHEPPMRPCDPGTDKVDRAILERVLHAGGDATLAQVELCSRGVLHSSYTAELVLDRFEYLAAQAAPPPPVVWGLQALRTAPPQACRCVLPGSSGGSTASDRDPYPEMQTTEDWVAYKRAQNAEERGLGARA